MHGNSCTRHGAHRKRADGRCRECLNEASKRYQRRNIAARKELQAIRAILANPVQLKTTHDIRV
jgi:hypothetical protein